MVDNQQSRQLIQQSFAVRFDYPVLFTRNAFDVNNGELTELLRIDKTDTKVLPVLDEGLLAATPELVEKIQSYFAKLDVKLLPAISMPGGEACKNDPTLMDVIYNAVEKYAIDRHSYILVIGGGAVVDAVGYAAATAHRGIRLIRMPSTVLGQNDAGVGVKNAINYHKRKNYLGTFVPPYAVINDYALLDSLEARDKRAGIAEAVKVALIKDRTFFDELYEQKEELAQFSASAMENMIYQGAKWHLQHIAHSGDAFEHGSARPLDFGHWSAHKLEELSNNELRHGEAVAIGIALDTIYSCKMGYLSEPEMIKVISLLDTLGFELSHPVIYQMDVKKALDEFKEHLGGICVLPYCMKLVVDLKLTR
ncbi:3-dehydroquinate synthase [Catenovulum sediminis]|uniref:3-dehydroquinate synthase n=1 Tax=Catenovulum sediminis TaxID=1740262 RepID=UPI001FE82628|nr:3-dehydroquinate synthase [Catenovulum sediminis]